MSPPPGSMRILQVVQAYPPKGLTGVETHTRALAGALSPRHTVDVLTFDPDVRRGASFALREERFPEATVHWAPLPSRRPARRADATLARAFDGLLQSLRPDVVHFQHLLRFPKVLPARCDAAGVPYVVSLHDYWWMCPVVSLVDFRGELCDGPEPRRCLRCVEGHVRWRDRTRLAHFRRRTERHRRILHGAGRIVANARWTARVHAECFGLALDRIEVIPEIVPLHRRPRRRLAPGSPLRVGFLGRASHTKGVGVLLDAIVRTRGAHHLSLHGGVAEDLAERVADAAHRHPDRVTDHGPYPHDRLPALLEDLDVVVLPSIWHETYGIVLDEAIASGVPVIATRMGGMPEHVSHGRTGLIVEPGDADALAAAIDRLADDYEALTEGLDAPDALPDFDHHVARFEAIYRALCDGSRSGRDASDDSA